MPFTSPGGGPIGGGCSKIYRPVCLINATGSYVFPNRCYAKKDVTATPCYGAVANQGVDKYIIIPWSNLSVDAGAHTSLSQQCDSYRQVTFESECDM